MTNSKSQYLDGDQSQAMSPTLTHHKNKATTPTSPMFMKLFNYKLTEYNYRELKEHNSNFGFAYSRQSSSDASVNSNFLSPNTSPCQSPGIRGFKKQASPSLINVKSPETSPLTSRSISQYSPKSLSSSTNISTDHNSSQSQSSINSSVSSFFSFDLSDISLLSINHQTSRSHLSKSLINLPRRVQRPISPLVMNNPPEGKNRINSRHPIYRSKRKNYGK